MLTSLNRSRKSAHCLRVAGHTPGTVQTWKDTAFDAGRGTEELPGFYSKEFAAAGYIGTLWFPHFLSTAYLLYTFPVAGGFLTRLCRFRSQNRHEPQTTVHPFSDHPDHLPHRKRRQNRSDSKSVEMSQKEDRHAGGHRQTDHIKRDLYVGIRGARNVSQFPREQICRYDRQTTAV